MLNKHIKTPRSHLVPTRYAHRYTQVSVRQRRAGRARLWLRSKRPACSERCHLDLPGFKNLEGLYVGLFSAYRRVRNCRNGNSSQILVYNDERAAWKRGEGPLRRESRSNVHRIKRDLAHRNEKIQLIFLNLII